MLRVKRAKGSYWNLSGVVEISSLSLTSTCKPVLILVIVKRLSKRPLHASAASQTNRRGLKYMPKRRGGLAVNLRRRVYHTNHGTGLSHPNTVVSVNSERAAYQSCLSVQECARRIINTRGTCPQSLESVHQEMRDACSNHAAGSAS